MLSLYLPMTDGKQNIITYETSYLESYSEVATSVSAGTFKSGL